MTLRIISGCIGAIIFLWFFVPGIVTGHFHIGVVTGVVIALILIVYAIFTEQINGFLKFLWGHIAGKTVIFAVLLAATAIIVLAVMCMVSMGQGMNSNSCKDSLIDISPPAETGSSDHNIELSDRSKTVIVLGCRVYSYGPSLMLKARLDAAYDYLMSDPDAVCVVCGGQGDNEPEAEASAMYDYLTGKGIEPSRIFVDNASEDTRENLINAAQIIKEKNLNPDCAIVTSDYHCYRALRYAERLGYDSPSSIPAGTLWWIFPSAYVREMYGILEMWFLN